MSDTLFSLVHLLQRNDVNFFNIRIVIFTFTLPPPKVTDDVTNEFVKSTKWLSDSPYLSPLE